MRSGDLRSRRRVTDQPGDLTDPRRVLRATDVESLIRVEPVGLAPRFPQDPNEDSPDVVTITRD